MITTAPTGPRIVPILIKTKTMLSVVTVYCESPIEDISAVLGFKSIVTNRLKLSVT